MSELSKRIVVVDPTARPPCMVYIRNATAANREVTIVAVGVHFFSLDSANTKDFLAGPLQLEIESGGGAPFVMNDPRFQVHRIEAAVLVRFGRSDQLHPPKEASFLFEYPDPGMASAKEQVIELMVELRASNMTPSTVTTANGGYHLVVRP